MHEISAFPGVSVCYFNLAHCRQFPTTFNCVSQGLSYCGMRIHEVAMRHEIDARNSVIILLSSSINEPGRKRCVAMRFANLFVVTLPYLFDMPSSCQSHSYDEIALRRVDMHRFWIQNIVGTNIHRHRVLT